MKKHFLTLLLAALLLSGCASDPEAGKSSSIYLTSMDTVMQLTAYGRGRDAALAEAPSGDPALGCPAQHRLGTQ